MGVMMKVSEYIANVDEKRKSYFETLFTAINTNIQTGFELSVSDSMISWVVPLNRYPNGYHVDSDTPLPFISLAAQKRHIGLYHMGIYASPKLLQWFESEYPKHSHTKLNMGKSCIRFTNAKKIPISLIRELVTKMSVEEWIEIYEANVK